MIHIDGIKDEMIANNLTPFRFTHPGEIIKDELEDRGISQRECGSRPARRVADAHPDQIQSSDGSKRQGCHPMDGEDSECSGGAVIINNTLLYEKDIIYIAFRFYH